MGNYLKMNANEALKGKSSVNGGFSIAMFDYRRLYIIYMGFIVMSYYNQVGFVRLIFQSLWWKRNVRISTWMAGWRCKNPNYGVFTEGCLFVHWPISRMINFHGWKWFIHHSSLRSRAFGSALSVYDDWGVSCSIEMVCFLSIMWYYL